MCFGSQTGFRGKHNEFFGDISMFNRKIAAVILTVTLFVVSVGFAQTLEENWNDFLHYIKIGLFDMAGGHAQAVLESDPDPVELLALSEDNPQG